MRPIRVVVTGLGVVSPLGASLESFWDGLCAGRSGIDKITHFDANDLPCRIAGEIPDFDSSEYMDRKEKRRTPRATHLAVAAAKMALRDAELGEQVPYPESSGIVMGTGVAGIENVTGSYEVVRKYGFSRLNPFQLPTGLANMPAAQIAKELRCLGPNNTTTTACAAGTQAVGEGAEYIRRGAADLVLAGGTEAVVNEHAISAFCAMRALPTDFNEQPQAASRPFDRNRQGFVLAEGAAVLVLENLENAVARGAKIYAEVIGHSSSSDAYHMIAMDTEGSGPERAMRWAIENAQISTADIDYINPHGTSTALNDATETKAIKRVFGDLAYELPISSTKSMTGHAMGATGALEAVACIMVINSGIIPPTINYQHPDPECDLYYVPNKAINRRVDVTLSNSFGLGGQNACLVLKRFNEG
jgi:beta-ketoacyl-acyl-carrier-protein synthase II